MFSFKRTWKCFTAGGPDSTCRLPLGFVFFLLKFIILDAEVLMPNVVEAVEYPQVQTIPDVLIIQTQ